MLMSGLDLERLVLSAGPVGIMQSCLDVSVPYAISRKTWDKPIITYQMVQVMEVSYFLYLACIVYTFIHIHASVYTFIQEWIWPKNLRGVLSKAGECVKPALPLEAHPNLRVP